MLTAYTAMLRKISGLSTQTVLELNVSYENQAPKKRPGFWPSKGWLKKPNDEKRQSSTQPVKIYLN